MRRAFGAGSGRATRLGRLLRRLPVFGGWYRARAIRPQLDQAPTPSRRMRTYWAKPSSSQRRSGLKHLLHSAPCCRCYCTQALLTTSRRFFLGWAGAETPAQRAKQDRFQPFPSPSGRGGTRCTPGASRFGLSSYTHTGFANAVTAAHRPRAGQVHQALLHLSSAPAKLPQTNQIMAGLPASPVPRTVP